MMRLPPFRLRRPASAAEAAAMLAGEGPSARVVAGGTDLFPNLKRRHQQAGTLVALARVPGLCGIAGDPATGLTIGALTTLEELARDARVRAAWPGLAVAAASISTPTLRHMGTIGGNLCLDTRCTYYNQNEEWRRSIDFCMKEAGHTCWVAPSSPRCWAISAADTVPLLCAVGAGVTVTGPAGPRDLAVTDLYRDDGIDYLRLQRDDVLTALRLPPVGALKTTYWKLRRRGSIDFPVLGVGAAVETDGDGTVRRAGLWLGAVSSAPLHAVPAEEALVGRRLDLETIARAAALARAEARPLDNTDFAMAWRARMAETYVDGALRELAGLPPATAIPRHGRHVLRTG